MERMELNVTKREAGKSASKKLRRGGSVPAILYGAGRDPLPLSVGTREIEGVIGTDAGWNVLLDLKIEGKESVLSRISDYQSDVLKRNLTHIDFQVLDLAKKIKTEVPIKFIGKAEGVKQGGIMEVSRRSLEVKCLPTNIPEHIDVDVSAMDVGDSIHVEELTIPEGVECLYETNFAIAAIVAPTLEIEPEIPEEGVVEGEVPAEGVAAAPAEGAKAKEGAVPTEGARGKDSGGSPAGGAEKKGQKKE